MRTVLDCLSGLAVAAAFNSPNALDHARVAIDEYLKREAASDPFLKIRALRDLRDAFAALKMDSAQAQAISGEIEAMMFDALAASTTTGSRP